VVAPQAEADLGSFPEQHKAPASDGQGFLSAERCERTLSWSAA